MPVITVTLSPKADKYVRSKVARRADLGRFISDLLVAAETREQVREELAQKPVTRQQWEATGVCVD